MDTVRKSSFTRRRKKFKKLKKLKRVEEVLLPLPGGNRGFCKSVSWYFGGLKTTQNRKSCLIYVMRQPLL